MPALPAPITSGIINEMLEHSKSFIEKPHPAFGNMPICPFAAQARISNRIRFLVTPLSMEAVQDGSELMLEINAFMEGKFDGDALICVHPSKADLQYEELEK